eukprot:CAMPEP_0185902286 /NCGR_PEP_ID=MMETSP0196C-20130402/1548_1 /TAXON_ID=2932 /ORGANISM="Alexandrium fundyense, Strain CCMP1719" /LENGTH=61 /DNA_ID=CAMNT_0028621099 /DNA_START=470 /DNA_END=655 /DNA_ORIENTATION=+
MIIRAERPGSCARGLHASEAMMELQAAPASVPSLASRGACAFVAINPAAAHKHAATAAVLK